MAGKRWKFVKKTFNVLGMSKASAQHKSTDDDNDESHNSEVELEIKRPSSQPITTQERAKSKKLYRRKKKDPSKGADKKEAKPEKAVAKPKSSRKKKEEESDALARARARREELNQFKKRTEEDIFLCKALGMDDNGMCLRHPNQHITTLGSTFEEVHRCRICDSESQVGSKAPRQRKSMATVIDQVKAMQANREDWRKRTKVMFWTSKQALDFDSDDDQALDEQFALTKEEWEEQVSARVTQVVAWRDENQLQAHPVFSRYFKMLDMGVPIEAAKNACQMDGYNPVVLDLDPAKPLKTQLGQFDQKTRSEFQALDLKSTDNEGEDDLDVPQLVTRVSASFQKSMARDMLEAVQALDALTEKPKKKKKSKRDSSKTEKSKQRTSNSSSKEKKKERTTNDTGGDTTLESPKKKKSKRDSSRKSTKGESEDSTDPSKKKKTRKSSRKSTPAKEGNEDSTTGDSATQAARIAELNRVLEEKDKEIEGLKEQLRQKDTIIQHLSKRTTTATRQKSSEFSSPTRPSMSSSEHAVVVSMSDDDDEASNDDVLQVPNVEYELPGYDFKTGHTNGTDEAKEGTETVAPRNTRGKEHGEHDGDESINSDAGAVAVVESDTPFGKVDDDDTSSASDVITTEDDSKILWRLEGSESQRNNPSDHGQNLEPNEKSDPKTLEENHKGDSTDDSDSDDEDGHDENDSSNGSEEASDSNNEDNDDDDDEEEVWLSDLEGGTSHDSDSSDEEEE